MLDFREHKRVHDSLSDVLPWAALIAPEVVLNKDGSFLATIRYRGPDLDSSTEEERVVKVAHINNILKRLGSGWAIHAEAQRRIVNSYPEPSFPDPLSYLIDLKRSEAFQSNQHYETKYYLSLVFMPPRERETQLAGKFVNASDDDGINYQRVLEGFRSQVKQTLDLLARHFPEAQILSESDLLTYLHSTISSKNHSVKMPPVPMYLDALLPDEPLLGGFRPKLGHKHLAVVGILGFPGSTQPELLDALNRIPVEYRWVSRYICLGKGEAKRELETLQRKWFAKRKSVGTLIKELFTNQESNLSDSDAVFKSQDAEEALLELGSEDVAYGYLTTTFTLAHSSPETLTSLVSEVERVINGVGFTTKYETVNAIEAWLGSLPGNTQRDVRRPLINTINLAHILPGASAVWGGDERNECFNAPPLLVAETGGNTPFRYSTHVGDVGHTLILGPTGAGKSTLLNIMEAQFLRYPGAQVYIFDKGGSSVSLTAGVGGEHYNLGAEDSDLFFQPLALVDSESERKWAHEWLLAIATGENVTVTPEIKRAVWDALQSLAATPREQRTMEALTVYLQNRELRDAFEPFTHRGAYGKLLDNANETLTLSRWQTFEMENLMESPSVVAPVLSYLFHRLNERFDGSPTLLVLDEAWLFLDHPIFASKIREWLKTLRKLNVSVLFATQSLSDVHHSPIAPTIKEACFTKIYLPNSVALQPDATEFYRLFGLNHRQIEILAFATPKQDYYYTSPKGNRLFQLALDDLALAYCSGASKERSALVRELQIKSFKTADFNHQFLQHLGLVQEAQELKELCKEAKEAA
jgi:type IV secretion/conjugal transfer VirB4 family ATPase